MLPDYNPSGQPQHDVTKYAHHCNAANHFPHSLKIVEPITNKAHPPNPWHLSLFGESFLSPTRPGIARKWVLDLTLSNLLLSATIRMLRLVGDLSVNYQVMS